MYVVVFFNVYNNFTFNGVRVSLWCFYFSESLFISCFFCSSCRTHTYSVCPVQVMYRALLNRCDYSWIKQGVYL